MDNVPHNIVVSAEGATCSCGRARVTPDQSDARDWANQHFKYNPCGMLRDERLIP